MCSANIDYSTRPLDLCSSERLFKSFKITKGKNIVTNGVPIRFSEYSDLISIYGFAYYRVKGNIFLVYVLNFRK